MLNSVEHENSFITSGPGYPNMPQDTFLQGMIPCLFRYFILGQSSMIYKQTGRGMSLPSIYYGVDYIRIIKLIYLG